MRNLRSEGRCYHQYPKGRNRHGCRHTSASLYGDGLLPGYAVRPYREYEGRHGQKLSNDKPLIRTTRGLQAFAQKLYKSALSGLRRLVDLQRAKQQADLPKQFVFLRTLRTRGKMTFHFQHHVAAKAIVQEGSNQVLNFMTGHEPKPLCFS